LLTTQALLRGGQSLDELASAFSLRVAKHAEFPLAILNYSQTDSPKHHPVVRECRGLVLECGTWNVVARAFPRFFSWGEAIECDRQFDWSNSVAQEKHDGSLVLAYRYGGKLFVNTRGSFGSGPIQKGSPLSWQTVFGMALANPQWESAEAIGRLNDKLPDGTTAVFELCSPWNRIVRQYALPTAYLLTAFVTHTGEEFSSADCDRLAEDVGAKRPDTFQFGSLSHARRFIDAQSDATFEGVVVRDGSGRRKKVKSGRYTALHHMLCGSEPALSPKTFAPFLMNGGDVAALAAALDGDLEHFYAARTAVKSLLGEMRELWGAHRNEADQKTFAVAVQKSDARSFLFEARKRQCHPDEIWRERGESFLSHWLVGRIPKPSAPLTARQSELESLL
jgi:hypothetical protein